MGLRFFDANAWFGRPMQAPPAYVPPATAAELEQELAARGVARALVWHVQQDDGSPVTGNASLSAAISGSEALLGCWALLPPQTGEVIGPDFFAAMKAARIAALRAFPDSHRYLLRRVVFGAFLDEVAERRIPLLLSLARGIAWPAVYDFLAEYPALTCVLCDIGTWSADRYTYPLLDAYPNVLLETSLLSVEDGGVESVVRRFGAERVLFGSGYPQHYVEAATLQLTHADISVAERELIGYGNMARILEEMEL